MLVFTQLSQQLWTSRRRRFFRSWAAEAAEPEPDPQAAVLSSAACATHTAEEAKDKSLRLRLSFISCDAEQSCKLVFDNKPSQPISTDI